MATRQASKDLSVTFVDNGNDALEVSNTATRRHWAKPAVKRSVVEAFLNPAQRLGLGPSLRDYPGMGMQEIESVLPHSTLRKVATNAQAVGICQCARRLDLG